MRHTLILLFVLAFGFAGISGNWYGMDSSKPVPAKSTLVSSNIESSVVTFTLGGFNLSEVTTPKGAAFIPGVDEGSFLLEAGAPDLQKLTSSLIIPDMAGMEVKVLSASFQDYPGIEIAPSKGNLLRTVDPASVPYTYGEVYQTDAFFPGKLAELRDPFIARDLRGQTVIIYPFQYNPVTKMLRVYTEITVEMVKVSETGINPMVRRDADIRIEDEWVQIYSHQFLNFDAISYTPLEEYGNLLIIAHGPFMDAMQPYVDWKTSMGYPTEMVDVSTIGTSASQIKDYIEDYYNTNGLSFVLLVGDAPQIPTNKGGGLGGPSDNAYGYLAGNDSYQELLVGRFSAENAGQVEIQVERTLEYEQNPQFLTDDWFTTVMGIASDQGPGDDNEYDYQHIRNMTDDCLAYTYTWNPEYFDGSQGGNDDPGNPSASSVENGINDGTGLILYTGHGSTTSWSTSGFSNSNVNNLVNNGMYPFVWSVACVNGNFENTTCFAEAWLRASDNGDPTGAIGFLGSTINQSWNPPMEGQDEMVDILVESYTDNIKRTFAGLSINGCFKMNDTYGNQGDEMTDTWTVFGDPTVYVRTDNPGTMTVTHDPTLFVGSTSLTVNCNVEGARATASMNGAILATELVSGGSVQLTFPALTSPTDLVHLVVTAYNYIPYITDIQIITPNGPYIQYVSNTVNDQTGNNDQLVDYGEGIYLTVGVKNLGVEATSNLNVTVATPYMYINQTDSTENYGVVEPDEIKEVSDGYFFTVSSNIPDSAAISFMMTAVDGTQEWTSEFSIMAHAPNLQLTGTDVVDPSGNNNNRLDPGETADIELTLENKGSAEAFSVVGNLISISPYISVVSDSRDFGNMATGQANTQSFGVTVDPTAPEGQLAPFMLEITADRGLTKVVTFDLVVGKTPLLVVDFDGNQNSASYLVDAAEALGLMSEYETSIPAEMDDFASVFVCLGVYPDKYVLSTAEGNHLKDFLEAGGRAYMEGGDTWKYDPQTPVHPMFYIMGINDGESDLATITGLSGTFTEGMSFSYDGDNKFIDRILNEGTAFNIFKNSQPNYYNAIAYDGGTYRTIGTSFEFGGLTDGAYPSTKQQLMVEYLTFFGIDIPALAANFAGYPTNIVEGENVNFYNFSSGSVTGYEWTFPGGTPATSTEPDPVVFYDTPGTYDVTLTVSDGLTTNTMTKSNYIVVDNITGVGDARQSLTSSVVPNPSKGIFRIQLGSAKDEVVDIAIYNTMGTLVYAEEGVTINHWMDKNISIPTAPNGLYILNIQGDQSVWTGKIVINK